MAEELRIVVVDQGGATGSGGGGGGPSVPASGGVPTPPPFVKPPPERQPPVRVDATAAMGAIATARGIGATAAGGNVGAAAGATAGVTAAAIGGPVGIAIAAVAAGFGVAAVAARKFAQVIDTQVQQLAGFSGPLAAAQAQSEIRRELATIRRAGRLGGDLAEVEDLRSRWQDAMHDIGTEILKILLEALEAGRPFIEFATDILNRITDFLENRQLPGMAWVIGPLQAILVEILTGQQQDRQDRKHREAGDVNVLGPFARELFENLPLGPARQLQPPFWPRGLSIPVIPEPGV